MSKPLNKILKSLESPWHTSAVAYIALLVAVAQFIYNFSSDHNKNIENLTIRVKPIYTNIETELIPFLPNDDSFGGVFKTHWKVLIINNSTFGNGLRG